MAQQVAPAMEYTAQSASPVNPIIAAVGPRFALVPKIYPYGEGCGNPVLPQSVSIVAVGDIQSPMHLKQVVNQVNSSAQPAPFTAHIAQSTCLCFNNSTEGVYAPMQVMDAGGSPAWSLERVIPCFGVCPEEYCHARMTTLDNAKTPVGRIEFNPMPCGQACAWWLCLCICRSPTVPEWAWMSALDPHDRERLTFRVPAKEGECLLCSWHRPASYGNCCASLPDMPYHEHTDLYGPMPQPGVIGAIDVRGAYGWDAWLCCQTFGVRPEMMTTINLTQNLSFEDTALAIQMALQRTQAQLEWRAQDGMKHKLPFLKPGMVTMQ